MKLIPQLFIKISILVIAFAIFYFSWLPSGNFGEETHLPQWLLKWCNTYYNLRTAIPFIALSFLMSFRYKVINVLVICMVLVTVAEFGQYFIPQRVPDFRDVLYGLLGTLFGIILALSLFKKRVQHR